MNQKGSKNRKSEDRLKLDIKRNDYDNRTLDIYETNPEHLDALLELENYEKDGVYFECCCGINRFLENRLKELGYDCYGTDILYGDDFLDFTGTTDYIITNPPFNLNLEFTEKCFEVVKKKFSFLVPLNYLDTMKRYKIFHNADFPIKNIFVFSKRISFLKGGGIPEKCITGMSFCWITWDREYKGKPYVEWIKKF